MKDAKATVSFTYRNLHEILSRMTLWELDQIVRVSAPEGVLKGRCGFSFSVGKADGSPTTETVPTIIHYGERIVEIPFTEAVDHLTEEFKEIVKAELNTGEGDHLDTILQKGQVGFSYLSLAELTALYNDYIGGRDESGPYEVIADEAYTQRGERSILEK